MHNDQERSSGNVLNGFSRSLASIIDIDNLAQGFWNKMSGLTEEERTGMNDILHPQDSEDPVLVDIWRYLHPADEEHMCAKSLNS